MNDKIKDILSFAYKDLIDKAYKTDSIAKNKWRIENRKYLRKQRKLELKILMEKENKNSIEWLIEKCAYSDLRPELWEIIKQQAREMYHDEIEALIIKQCAEQSTSEAHKKEIHRQQIIAAYKAAMHTQYLESHTLTRYGYIHKAEQYYNETYNL